MRRLRVAHIGNIAGNAYLLAKFHRRLGIEADSFDLGGGQPMWLPWWEESDLDPKQLHPAHYDWLTVAAATGVPRPPWAKILGVQDDQPWYDTQEGYQADFARLVPAAVHGQTGLTSAVETEEIVAALAESRLAQNEQRACVRGVRDVACWRSVRAIANHYDLLVLYGPFAGCGAVLPREVPYITFEHSTMRMVPLLDKPDRILLAAAYRHADANIITNADCREAAWCLDLDPARLRFIPHPVDTDSFSPDSRGEDQEAASVRERIRDGVPGGADLLFFAPARQSRSAETGAKRNDRVFYAFKRYVEEAEPAGAPRAALIAGMWGDGPQVAQTVALVQALGLGERVVGLNAQPKRRMRSLYRACDVVLDQFDTSCGSFGTVTAEALACGRPVITHVNEAVHAWCADRMPVPPVANAATAPEIYERLRFLATHTMRREELGRAGRRWVEQYHSWERVAREHLDLYDQVLAERAHHAPSAPSAPAASLPAAGASVAVDEPLEALLAAAGD